MIVYNTEDFIQNNFHFFSCAEAPWDHMHKHDFYEIAYVYEGIGEHRTENEILDMHIGDFILISPGYAHCIVSTNNTNKIRIHNCLFEKNFFEDAVGRVFCGKKMSNTEFYKLFSSKKPFCLTLFDNEDQTMYNLINLARKEYALEEYCSPPAIKRYLDIILLETSRALDNHLGIAEKLVRRREDIVNLMQFIRANISMKLTVGFLAEQIHLSPEYLSKYFKKHTGKTISQFLSETRIAKAKLLLRQTDRSITDIGYICGYSSPANFRKYFTKIAGLSPREYRKKYNQE